MIARLITIPSIPCVSQSISKQRSYYDFLKNTPSVENFQFRFKKKCDVLKRN